MLVAVEGLDKAGKTSTVSRACDEIGFNYQAFPDRTTFLGKLIDNHLKNNNTFNAKTLHLLFSANRWEQCDRLFKNTIIDRYWYSGVAYAMASGLEKNWCLQPDIGLPKPDLTIFFDVDPLNASKRGNYGKDRFENIVFQEKVYEAYKEILPPDTIFLNANNHPETVYDNFMDILSSYVLQ